MWAVFVCVTCGLCVVYYVGICVVGYMVLE